MPAPAVAQVLAYNPITGALTWRRRPDCPEAWNARYAGKLAGTKKKGEIQISVKWAGRRRLYRAHHLAWAILKGEWPRPEVDHEDGDPHNNRAVNLRLATRNQNTTNRKSVVGQCRYRGVYWIKAKGRYAAQIKSRGVSRWLGLHSTAGSAARAYDHAALALHGEFAVTNASLGLLGGTE